MTASKGSKKGRRVVLRPGVAVVALLCLAAGVVGLVIAGRNFTLPSQDSELMPTTMAEETAAKQPWLDFSGGLLLVGVAGLVLLPFSFRGASRGPS